MILVEDVLFIGRNNESASVGAPHVPKMPSDSTQRRGADLMHESAS